MKPSAGQFLLLFLLTLPLAAVGQPVSQLSYRVIVHLTDGGQVRGVLDEVANGKLAFLPSEPVYFRHTPAESYLLPLNRVERVVVKRTDKRRAIRTGLIVGSLAGGYLAYRSGQRNPFRSPVLGAAAIVLSAGALGAAGALVGSLLGDTSRRVIRPLDRDNPVESLERQLRPFTREYLEQVQFNPQ